MAVAEPDVLKIHTTAVYLMLAAAPQPSVCGQQVQCREQSKIISTHISCGESKSCPMLFVKVCHMGFLTFHIFFESFSEGRTAYLVHGVCRQYRSFGGDICKPDLRFFKANAKFIAHGKYIGYDPRLSSAVPFGGFAGFLRIRSYPFSLSWNRKSPPVFMSRRAMMIIYPVAVRCCAQRPADWLQGRGIRPRAFLRAYQAAVPDRMSAFHSCIWQSPHSGKCLRPPVL